MKPTDARLQRLYAPIKDGMAAMRGVLAEELATDAPAVADMTDHISRFQGKQLRAALVLLVGKATNNDDAELPQVAAIVELIHLATLVHDDVLDGAEVRRRVACVNERWDNQVAVLLGDWLYSRAFHRSTTLSSRLASQRLATTSQEICVGEIPESRYERIAGAKTAALYAAACELGASYPSGDAPNGEAMGRFGWELGLAFQIIDDVLDLTGTEDVVGKSVGNDVEDGKVTLAVLRTYATADADTRQAIRDVYTRPDLDDRVARLREACDLGPGLDYARARANALLTSARGRLAALGDSPARDALERMMTFLQERRF
jgi:octaprenyl-diphosphate synthase